MNLGITAILTLEEFTQYGLERIDGTSAREHHECPICYREVTELVSTRCGHVYCRECACQWFDDEKLTCPTCRTVCFCDWEQFGHGGWEALTLEFDIDEATIVAPAWRFGILTEGHDKFFNPVPEAMVLIDHDYLIKNAVGAVRFTMPFDGDGVESTPEQRCRPDWEKACNIIHLFLQHKQGMECTAYDLSMSLRQGLRNTLGWYTAECFGPEYDRLGWGPTFMQSLGQVLDYIVWNARVLWLRRQGTKPWNDAQWLGGTGPVVAPTAPPNVTAPSEGSA